MNDERASVFRLPDIEHETTREVRAREHFVGGVPLREKAERRARV